MSAPFSPGDKVVRIGGNDAGATLVSGTAGTGPAYGTIHCVDECFPAPTKLRSYHHVWIVGFGRQFFNGDKVGYPAHAFRKVEEARLAQTIVAAHHG